MWDSGTWVPQKDLIEPRAKCPYSHLADVGALVLLVQVLDHERPLGAVAALAVQLEALVLREDGVARAQDVPVPPPDP